MDSPGEILSKAKDLVEGDRAKQHGDFIETHNQIAAMASVVLDDKLKANLTASDVLKFMVVLKLGRIGNGSLNPDDVVDLCGYAALAGAAMERECGTG